MPAATTLYLFIALIPFLACDESLPPYAEPEVLLESSVQGFYVLNFEGNRLNVVVRVKNLFEETLQGPAELKGTVEIISERNPQVRKTLSLSSNELQNTGVYNPATGILTFNTGSTLSLQTTWNFVEDDNGLDVRRDFFTYVVDSTCASRCLARREYFFLRAQLTVFKGRAPVTATATFPLCYVSRFVPFSDCPGITTNPPCFVSAPTLARDCVPTSF